MVRQAQSPSKYWVLERSDCVGAFRRVLSQVFAPMGMWGMQDAVPDMSHSQNLLGGGS